MNKNQVTTLAFVAFAMLAFCSQVQAAQASVPTKQTDVSQDAISDHGVKNSFGSAARKVKNLTARFMTVWTALPDKTKVRANAQLKKMQEKAGHVAQTLADHVMTVVKASSIGKKLSFKKNLAEQDTPNKSEDEAHTYPEKVQRDTAHVKALENSSINKSNQPVKAS